MLRRVLLASLLVAMGMLGTALGCSTFSDAPGSSDASVPTEAALDARDAEPLDASDAGDHAEPDADPGSPPRFLYVFGGVERDDAGAYGDGGSLRAEVLADGGLGDWERTDAFATNRANFGVATLESGAVLIAGGSVATDNAGSNPSDVTMFAPAGSTTFALSTSLPAPYYGLDIAARGAVVVIAGGSGLQPYLGTLAPQGPKTWTTLTPLNAGQRVPVFDGDDLYVVGGNAADGPRSVYKAIENASIFDGGTVNEWHYADSLPVDTPSNHRVVAVSWGLVAVGGSGNPRGVLVRDRTMATPAWETRGPMPDSMQALSACAFARGDRIYVVGGEYAPDQYSSGVAIGDASSPGFVMWGTGPRLPRGRSRFGCTIR